MRRILASALVLLAAGAFLVVAGGASNGSSSGGGTYKIELDNAFGLVTGADFKVAGVRAGKLQTIEVDQKSLHALVTVAVTVKGFGQFHRDATCDSRPQSLIGEYFLECQPGNSGPALKSGSVIPVSHTSTTIAPDLLNDIQRMPIRQRFSLLINELGAAVAGRSDDLQAAIHRAVPALTQTDNLLNTLANDASTLQSLTVNSDSVITALAKNSTQVQRFVIEANNAATHSANQRVALRGTFHQLPGFLEQLRPAMQKLGQTADANVPVLQNLNSASGNLARLFRDLVPFSASSRIGIKSLGTASVTGTQAVKAAGPLVAHLNTFAKPTPELAQNLAIVLNDLNNRSRAVEADVRSPGGKGYTGLEALLQYVFNQALAINIFGPFGHLLAVDGFIDTQCAPYATPPTIALSLAKAKSNPGSPDPRHCYAWLGPNQPGVNTTDPSNPSAPVPDPGGAPPGQKGPSTSAAALTAAQVMANPNASADTGSKSSRATSASPSAASSPSSAGSGAATGAGSSTAGSPAGAGSGSSQSQTQQLLNYLLAP